jgi:photosystem II stability/assembly factor-like uncharacterized protein
MAEQDLDALYREAKAALWDKDYERARQVLTQILLVDEDYRDASSLLQQALKLRRRKWYRHPLLWGIFAMAALIGLWGLVAPLAQRYLLDRMQPVTESPIPVVEEQGPAQAVTVPAAPASTPVPWAWKRLSMGLKFPRDQITAIVFDPHDPQVMYAGMRDSGVYKSIDGGRSWAPSHTGLTQAKISSLLIVPDNPQTLYANAGTAGVFKSLDGGQTWISKSNGMDPMLGVWGTNLVMDPNNSQRLWFARHAEAIYETLDGGESWMRIFGGVRCLGAIMALQASPAEQDVLFAGGKLEEGCPSMVYRSADGGRTWSALALQVPGSMATFGLWIGPSTGRMLYAQIGTEKDEQLWLSADGGQTWAPSLQGGCTSLVFDPANDQKAYCGKQDTLSVTSDGGSTWTRLAQQQAFGTEITELAILADDPVTLFIGGRTLYRLDSSQAKQEESGSGLGGSHLELRMSPGRDPGAFYAELGEKQQAYISTDHFRTWKESVSGPLAFEPGGSLLAMDWKQNQLLHSTGQGATETTGRSLPANRQVDAIAAHPVQAGLYYAMYDQGPPYLLYSTDGGDTWAPASGAQPGDSPRLFFDQLQGEVIYQVSLWTILRSDVEFGKTWASCGARPGDVWASPYEARAEVHPLDAQRLLLASQGGGVLISEDGCRHWVSSKQGLGSLYVNTISIDPTAPQTIYAATDGGAYVSFDGGTSWGLINDGLLGANVVYSIVVDKDGQAYASTPYGIFQLEK